MHTQTVHAHTLRRLCICTIVLRSHVHTQRSPKTGKAARGQRSSAQTRLPQPEGETEPGKRGVSGGPQGFALSARAVPPRRVALKRCGGALLGPLPSPWPLPLPSPKRPSFPLLCAQGKHSEGRRSPRKGAGMLSAAGHCHEACCGPRSLLSVPEAGHTPDMAQDSRRQHHPKERRTGGCQGEVSAWGGLRNAPPFRLSRCGGICTELGHGLPPPAQRGSRPRRPY